MKKGTTDTVEGSEDMIMPEAFEVEEPCGGMTGAIVVTVILALVVGVMIFGAIHLS